MKKDSNATAKEDILNAALNLFMKKGYVNTSMDDIAEAVGLTKGGVYYYVDKKEDMLTDIHDQMLDSLIDRVKVAVDAEDDPRRKMSSWIREYTKTLENYHPHIKIFFTEINHFPKDSFERLSKRRDMIPAVLDQVLEYGIAKNKIRGDVDRRIIKFLILGMINWMYIWYQPKGELTLDQIIEGIEKVVLDGIKAAPQSEPAKADGSSEKLPEPSVAGN